jgi:hypothetical protein
MVDFIRENLFESEKIIYTTQCHWTVFVSPILWLATALFFLSTIMVLQKLSMIPFILSLITGIRASYKYFLTELLLTNQRLILKTGFFQNSIKAINLNQLSKIEINQPFWGKLLNYGTFKIFDASDTMVTLNHIQAPVKTRRLIQNQTQNDLSKEIPEE